MGTFSTEFISSLITATGLIIALLTFAWQARNNIRTQRAEYIYRLEDKYDDICKQRSERPQLMRTADTWATQSAHKPYSALSDEERAYYHHAETVIGLIEIATYMTFADKTIPQKAFTRFIRPMIALEVRYNRAIFEQFLASGSLAISNRSAQLIRTLLAESGT